MASRQVFKQHRTDPRLAIGLDQAAGHLDFWCRPDPEPALMAASPEYDLALREMVSGHEAIQQASEYLSAYAFLLLKGNDISVPLFRAGVESS
jgi:hypothetical protein